MFQSDKLLKQSLIILSQLGTVFLCRHKLVFPAASAPTKLSGTSGKTQTHILSLSDSDRDVVSDYPTRWSEAGQFDAGAVGGAHATSVQRGLFCVQLPPSAFHSPSWRSWHQGSSLVMLLFVFA